MVSITYLVPLSLIYFGFRTCSRHDFRAELLRAICWLTRETRQVCRMAPGTVKYSELAGTLRSVRIIKYAPYVPRLRLSHTSVRRRSAQRQLVFRQPSTPSVRPHGILPGQSTPARASYAHCQSDAVCQPLCYISPGILTQLQM